MVAESSPRIVQFLNQRRRVMASVAKKAWNLLARPGTQSEALNFRRPSLDLP